MSFDDIERWLTDRRDRGLYRHRRIVGSPQGNEIIVDGRKLLNFCSNDYLGLANDKRLKEAFKQGADQWGVGASASHLISGHTHAHDALEEILADFVGRPRALLFSSGYAANMGTINSLVSEGDHVFQDRLNHASLLDGGWISRAHFHWFKHRDTKNLEEQLERTQGASGRSMVISDGTFSMDGDFCRIDSIVQVAQKHNSWVMVDDAHGIGVHGQDGVGLIDPKKFSTEDIPVLVGTLGKAFGTSGAFVAGEESLIELLIQKARSYVYSTAMPSAIAVATMKSVEIVKKEQWRREHLTDLINIFRDGARSLGFQISDSISPIQPLLLGNPERAMKLSSVLEDAGILISAIRPPTVPEGTSRLRITLTAAHTIGNIEKLLESLRKADHG